MSKNGKKSIADLLASKPLIRKPTLEEVEVITSKIHQSPNEPQGVLPQTKGKTKKISLNAPVALYLKAKTNATLRDQSLMAYILELVEKDASA